MSPLRVRIEELKPMHVAVARVVSESPELDALTRLIDWAETAGLMGNPDSHPMYGYTFQRPQKSTAVYGYEIWMKITEETAVSGDITAQDFPGGLYAAATHHGPPGPDVWMQLWNWVKASPYTRRSTHELEHPRNPLAMVKDLIFDMYLPINGM